MNKPTETIMYKGYTINIYPDQDAENPREMFDSLGTMTCFHKRYILGDKHNYSSPHEFLEDITGLEIDEKSNLVEVFKDVAVILPLYLYDHSGITMSTNKFSCPWDSGQVGYIYVTNKKLVEEKLNERSVTEIEDILRAEVETYDTYLRGGIYGYEILDPASEMVESVWGFYGYDNEKSGLLPDAKSLIDHCIQRISKAHFEQLKAQIKHHVPLSKRTGYPLH